MQSQEECVLYISKMENSISADYIKMIFMKLGTVKQINEIPYAKYKKIFVHILLDNTTQSPVIKTLLSAQQSIKIVHSMPWYWTCSEYVKPIHGPNPNIMAEL